MTRLARILLIALLTATTLTACSRRRPPEVTTTAPAPVTGDDADRARRDSIARAEADRRALDERSRAERERAERLAERRRVVEAPIYFDFDRSDLSADARGALDAKLDVLTQHPSLRILVAGHADERGSDTYNLALGQRRAAAAKRYLVQRGVADRRIEVVSYGEERPVCTESAESCWAQNRRDEFTITSGDIAGRP